MDKRKQVRIHNKSDKPDNIVNKEYEITSECEDLQQQLPSFMRGYFAFIKAKVLPLSRLAYLHEVTFFCDYLINETDLTKAKFKKDIKQSDFNNITAVDVNLFLEYCRQYKKDINNTTYIYENNNTTLARKKSALSVLFKELYREGLVDQLITDGFVPLRTVKPTEREIKALQDNEVMVMLDAVSTGEGLTPKERTYWEKTKYRDKAILVLFLTYGLRLSELQQLNVSSFNFNRGEFLIYRKRNKESAMPINKSVMMVIDDYLKLERKSDDLLEDEHKDALFLSLQGRRMTQRQIRELVKKYTSIGMKTSRNGGYSPHKLRATCATSLIGRGNSIYDVAALLDHEQVTTTQLYAGHKMNVKRDLVKDMEWEIERNK